MDPTRLNWRSDRSVVVSPDGAEVWMFGGTEADIVARAVNNGMEPARAREVLGRWRASGHVVPDNRNAPNRLAMRVLDRAEGLNDAATLAAAVNGWLDRVMAGVP